MGYILIYQRKNKYGFEIHITVRCLDDDTLERFKTTCERINAKCISIGLNNTKQVMTSKTIYETQFNMDKITNHDINQIKQDGFDIQRIKIECEPKLIHDTNLPWSYYEIHVPCDLDIELFDLSTLQRSWHLSKNLFKPDTRMITCRETNESLIKQIDEDIMHIKSLSLVKPNFKHHYEYAIYDSNINLDKGWIN